MADSVRSGASAMDAAYVGSSAVDAIYLGATQVYSAATGPAAPPTSVTWWAYYDPADIALSDGANVTGGDWTDGSGNGRHLTTLVSGTPTYDTSLTGLGNNPGVIMPAGAELASALQTAVSYPGALVVVCRAQGATTWSALTVFNTRDSGIGIALLSTDAETVHARAGQSASTTPAVAADTNVHLWIADVYDPGSGQVCRLEHDGANIGQAGPISNNTNRVRIASFPEGTEVAFVGVVAGSALTTQQRSDIESWAASRFGITMS